MAALAQNRAGMLLVSPDSLFTTQAERIAAFAVQHKIPTLFAFREAVLAGGFASYGPVTARIHRDLGRYVGRILKGDRPGDLPVAATHHLRIGRQSQNRKSPRP